jgi:outer membrane protein OmpA-like peptidoglycan-associated protein
MARCALLGFLWVLGTTPASAQAPGLIFFQPHSAALGVAGENVLNAFAAQARQGGVAIEVIDVADPEGGTPYNRALSLARAEHAAHLLRELGVPADRVTLRSRGPVATALDGQESRRVELRLVP